jgi:hypothetical protein
VDIKGVLVNLMNRLSGYAKKDSERLLHLSQSSVYEHLQELISGLMARCEPS